ncbi:MAG: repeat containing protein [Phycisphaerales bacterium]|nr:repeat containing protein [Phycisphaerales bacterium]
MRIAKARSARKPVAQPLVERLECRQFLSATTDVFSQTNLVSDGAVPAANPPDTQLLNPWGVSFAPNGVFWVSDNNAGVATLYDGAGVKQGLVVNIPGGGGQDGAPTGQVFNGTSGFVVTKGTASGAAVFIFAGEDGGISAWSPKVDLHNAQLEFDGNTQPGGAVYKGLAIGNVKTNIYLYAANFRSGNVDVFNSGFQEQHWKGAFQDKKIPKGFAPFNVQNLNGQIAVTYAKQDAAKHDDIGGAGNGFVDIFSTSGHLVRRLRHGNFLDSPWGLAIAPKSFDKLAGDILVGNFRSGNIDAFTRSGRFVTQLSDTNNNPISIDDLWALTPGTGATGSSTQSIYFTAGINDEADGLFGRLDFSKADKLKPTLSPTPAPVTIPTTSPTPVTSPTPTTYPMGW